jgi:DnaD/phage-associated family protein
MSNLKSQISNHKSKISNYQPPTARFEGFPAGELHFTSVPDLFFSALLPAIEDLAELKIILHVIWLRQRQARQVVSRAELAADETLARGLAALGGDAELALADGLAQAVARGALLHAVVEDEDVYALNSAGGRGALARIESGEVGAVGVTAVDRPSVEPRPNIFELYEDNIGLLSPILADELRDAEATYPANWIEDAFRIAAENNVRKWRYVQAILEHWAAEGKDNGTSGRDNKKKRSWLTDEEFEQFFKH